MDTAQSLNQISIILYWICLGAYSVYWLFGFTPWKLRFPILLGIVLLHIATITIRGISIEYFPLTNKFESFNAFAAAAFIVLLIYAKTESHIYRMSFLELDMPFL